MNKGFYSVSKSKKYEAPTSASYAVTASYISPTFISASAAAAGFGSGGSGSVNPGNGYIPYNNIGVFDDTNIYYDGANLGIGTVNPAYKLDVSGSGRFRNGLIVSGSTYLPTISQGATTNVVTINPTTGQLYYTASSAVGAGLVDTSQFVTNSQTGSFIKNSQTGSMTVLSSSYASTASYIIGYVPNSQTGSFVTNTQTGSFITNSQTGSMNVLSSSYAATSSYVVGYVANSQTGSFVTNSQTSSFVRNTQTGSFVTNQQTSSFVTNQQTGSFATTGSNNFNGSQTITGSLSQGLEGNIATGEHSHAEGSITKAIGNYSHAEGDFTQAKGDYSHAEGQETIASGSYSHAEGYQTIASANWQHVQGQWNATSSVQSAFIVGNGTDNNNRSNLIHAAGNEIQITGSIIFNEGARITPTYYGNSYTGYIDIVAGAKDGFVELLSYDASSSFYLDDYGTYLYTSSGSLVNLWEFRNDGRLLAPRGIEAPSFTGSLQGTASYTTNALTASYAPNYVLNSVTSSMLQPYVLSTQTGSMTVASASYVSSVKAGSGSVVSFTGTPLVSAITFGTAYSNNLYSVTITGEDPRVWSVQSKSATGFTINSNSSITLTGPVYWIATAYN